jgi:hypothetical protein
LSERAVRGPRAPPRRRQVGRDDRVEGGIVRLDPLQIMLEQLEAADLAAAHRAREPLR